MPAPVPTETSRWRCTLCGNLTRFDVHRSTRVREYVHVSLAGLPVVEERQVLAETVERVTCRWCGRADSVEVVPRPGEPVGVVPRPGEPVGVVPRPGQPVEVVSRFGEPAAPGVDAAMTGEPAEHPAGS